jgi:hypothetical protein
VTGPGPESASATALRWRRVFRGEEPELRQVRLWLAWLLPEHPCRDDVIAVAAELSTNALRHTVSRGRWFAVEVSWRPPAVRVAVADCGGDREPQVIDDPAAEHGRGLLLVRGLSLRTGVVGDRRGRLVWADVAWPGATAANAITPPGPFEAAIRDGETELARQFRDVPAWFGRSTLAWWAMPGTGGLVSAPSAGELAGALYRLLDPPPPAAGEPQPQIGELGEQTEARRDQTRGVPCGIRAALRPQPSRTGLLVGVLAAGGG